MACSTAAMMETQYQTCKVYKRVTSTGIWMVKIHNSDETLAEGSAEVTGIYSVR